MIGGGSDPVDSCGAYGPGIDRMVAPAADPEATRGAASLNNAAPGSVLPLLARRPARRRSWAAGLWLDGLARLCRQQVSVAGSCMSCVALGLQSKHALLQQATKTAAGRQRGSDRSWWQACFPRTAALPGLFMCPLSATD
jgi:hypothetical protein